MRNNTVSKSADEAGEWRSEIEGNIYITDDLMLRVPTVKRKLVVTCMVSDAQDCPCGRLSRPI